MKVYVVSVEEYPVHEYEETYPYVAGVFTTRDKAELYIFNNFPIEGEELEHIGPSASEPWDCFSTSVAIVDIDELDMDEPRV